jgi:hypothetical protein
MISGLRKLPIIFTCMIAHGHMDERYVQYLNELWPNDPNFNWLFVVTLLHLKSNLVLESNLLFEEPP